MVSSSMSSMLVNETEQQKYFGELLDYDHARLKNEPTKLEDKIRHQKKLLEDCVWGHANVYIEIYQKQQELKKLLQESTQCAARVHKDSIPELLDQANACRSLFSKENDVRSGLRQVYAHQGSLLNLLEIPSLMDTCVRAGNYDEALELKSFGKKLRMIHGENTIVQMISREIEHVLEGMKEQLLDKLQSNIQLSECLTVVGYLKRVNASFDADERMGQLLLRREFLERRGCWIETSLKDLGDSLSPYEYLKKITDIYRLQVFDILMQYKAIFYPKEEDAIDLSDPSFSWSYKWMTLYIRDVGSQLPSVEDGGSLASVLDHCMYCGKALARVGLDFRPAIFPMFENAAFGIFDNMLNISDHVFDEMMATHKWIQIPSMSNKLMDNGDETSKSVNPPMVLVEHPPLAVYTNGILAALNELRHCAPKSIKHKVASRLQQSFSTLVSLLQKRKLMDFSGDESIVFDKACGLVQSVQLPFLIECFSTIYGSPNFSLIPDHISSILSSEEKEHKNNM